jgi:hypothetical protein
MSSNDVMVEEIQVTKFGCNSNPMFSFAAHSYLLQVRKWTENRLNFFTPIPHNSLSRLMLYLALLREARPSEPFSPHTFIGCCFHDFPAYGSITIVLLPFMLHRVRLKQAVLSETRPTGSSGGGRVEGGAGHGGNEALAQQLERRACTFGTLVVPRPPCLVPTTLWVCERNTLSPGIYYKTDLRFANLSQTSH